MVYGKAEKMIKKTVTVNFLGVQRRITGEDNITIELAENMQVCDFIGLLKNRYPALDLEEGSVIITVNEEKVASGRILSAGDTISLLPHIGGG
ncbi:MoaD/ThiS family protein [Chloroflexota bacterium]